MIIASLVGLAFTTSVSAAQRNDFRGVKIVVDPGHGGKDGGAIAANGMREKFINLSVSKYLTKYLRHGGATVKMTRSDDRFVSLKGRAAIANRYRANRFVSVHQNSAPNRNSNGTETYYHKPQASRLSKFVQMELLKYLGHNNRGSRKAGFAVIRRTNMPAVLTEASFISQPKEAAKLVSGTYRQKQALAIYRALQKEYSIKPKIAKAKPAPKPQLPVAIKPLLPAKLQVQFTSKLGFVENKDVQSHVYIPYVTGVNDTISVANIGSEMAKPKISFIDLAGNIVSTIEPFLDVSSSYVVNPANIVGSDFIGSIDINESMGQIQPKFSLGRIVNTE